MAYSFGALTNPLDLGEHFEQIGASPAGGFTTENSIGKDRLGNYIAATNQQRNKKSELVISFRAINPDGGMVDIVLGGVGGAGEWVATKVTVRQVNNADAIVSVTLHQHDGNGNLHLAQKYTVSLPLSGYGVTANPITGLAGDDCADNCVSMEWSAEIMHKDKTNRLNDHLVGFSQGCRIDCTQTYVDNAETLTADPNWFIDSDVPSDDAEDTRSRVLRGHTFLAAD